MKARAAVVERKATSRRYVGKCPKRPFWSVTCGEHWCLGATRRGRQMAPRMNQVANALREKGMLHPLLPRLPGLQEARPEKAIRLLELQ